MENTTDNFRISVLSKVDLLDPLPADATPTIESCQRTALILVRIKIKTKTYGFTDDLKATDQTGKGSRH